MTPKEQAKAHYFDLVDYFTAKIKAQDYVIKDTTDRSIYILIDGFFHFNLWPGQTPDQLEISNGLTPSANKVVEAMRSNLSYLKTELSVLNAEV